MSRHYFKENRRFPALRACWIILRGRSIAYRINFTDGTAGDPDGLATNFVDCQMDGKPLTPWEISHLNPKALALEEGEWTR